MILSDMKFLRHFKVSESTILSIRKLFRCKKKLLNQAFIITSCILFVSCIPFLLVNQYPEK